MTAEQIIREDKLLWNISEKHGMTESIEIYMEKYSRQECIAVLEWVTTKCSTFEQETNTREQLYQQYIDSKTEQI